LDKGGKGQHKHDYLANSCLTNLRQGTALKSYRLPFGKKRGINNKTRKEYGALKRKTQFLKRGKVSGAKKLLKDHVGKRGRDEEKGGHSIKKKS